MCPGSTGGHHDPEKTILDGYSQSEFHMPDCRDRSCSGVRALVCPEVPVFGGYVKEVGNTALPTSRLFGVGRKLGNKPCLLERLVHTALLHGFKTLRRDGDLHLLVDFGDEDGLGLEVDLLAGLPGRVEFGRARAI